MSAVLIPFPAGRIVRGTSERPGDALADLFLTPGQDSALERLAQLVAARARRKLGQSPQGGQVVRP